MKLHFDPNQEYQLQAIRAVTDLFEGQPLRGGDFEFSLQSPGALHKELGVGNRLNIKPDEMERNVIAIQKANDIIPTQTFTEAGMHFSVEMETGTGKTYVYLRTMYELYQLYGFTKFVIVVPSIPIREGVLKSLQITHDHFQQLYNRTPAAYMVYDSKKPNMLRGFAGSNNIQILVLNIDSFSKDENIINKPNDRLTGRKPIEFIQQARPIVIIDEPQNMETDIRRKAIDNLNPLCTLRYSATHTNLYNLLYSLNPVKAYDLGLVKQIEVDAIQTENDFNSGYLELESITRTGNNIKAKLKLDVLDNRSIKRKSVSVARNALNLYKLSNENPRYDGLQVYEIDFGSQQVSFSNGLVLQPGQSVGGLNDEVMKFMMKRTIEEHLKKERQYNKQGVKVLSLFFIDKVKNYRDYNDGGQQVKGKYALWFEELFKAELEKPFNRDLKQHLPQDVHNGYFSADNKGRAKDTSGETQADDDTYKLIMKDKERLLDLETPLRFIFSHTALREGWDNPNVFQICTLNETKSELKKRQEIGRGLRLCVNQEGIRVREKAINRLTVVANERYEDFAKALQTEISEDFGVDFSGRIKNKAKRTTIHYRKGFEADPKFLAIWERIRNRTRYSVHYQTDELIITTARAIKQMPETQVARVYATKTIIHITDEGVKGIHASDSGTDWGITPEMPDMLAYIQSKTELTRSTIFAILQKSGRIAEACINPQMFMDNAVAEIKKVLHELMVDGIRYHKIGNQFYAMSLFQDKELESYLDEFTHTVNRPEKTIYESLMPLDSNIENSFAQDCENSEQVELYFKLPNWFKIDTPIGTYNPDWALVFKNETQVYFVAETKGRNQELLLSEQLKIRCGKAHFKEMDGVIYKQVSTLSELVK
jgi:type III restriction enzyme